MYSIVVPLYRIELLDVEWKSLKNCIIIFKDYPITLIMPRKFEFSDLSVFYELEGKISYEFFEDEYFYNLNGYNKLLISTQFYKRFTKFEYILVHQLDAFVFRDELDQWARLGYDYIGAPWIAGTFTNYFYESLRYKVYSNNGILKKFFLRVAWFLMGKRSVNDFLVGNGGLSLRRVSSHYRAAKWFERTNQHWEFNEDIFWSIYIPFVFLFFRTPKSEVAMKFAFDQYPEFFYEKCQVLPFGCHAWYRSDEPYKGNFDFWSNFIK